MNKDDAKKIVRETFENSFSKDRYLFFIKNLLNTIDESKAFHAHGYVPEKYKQTAGIVKTYERLGTYTDPEGKKIDILIVYLQKENSVDRARSTLRNFVADYLKTRDEKDAGLVAFVSPDTKDWRFSFIKMEYKFTEVPSGKVKVKEEFTPARRYSFLVGENESSHTAQSRLVPIIQDDINNPTLKNLEDAFDIEVVTLEFFENYRKLFLDVKESLEIVVKGDEIINKDFTDKGIDTIDFSKKLLGQIVFLYFLQKKGWFGVEKNKDWGTGSKRFLRDLFDGNIIRYENFFNDVLEPLFYDALARDKSDIDHFNALFNSKIPFLNGGLFDPIYDYDWVKTEINLPNDIFSNNEKTKEGDIGTGILDIFDRYNFTVREDEPLEKEVAIDPEMLGKVFEHLLDVKDRKSKGTYYTPREIVHYMCQESLINYLLTECEGKVNKKDIETLIQYGESAVEHDSRVEQEGKETSTYSYKLPESIRKNALLIDDKLKNIRVCDPAIGSGAFPVGMMNEIIRTRNTLTNYLGDKNDRSIYNFKRDAIEKSLYGVDIDLGAVEIAKLRLWLSLIVDEENIKNIKPLPNLDYKIMQGNSLIEFITPESLAKTTDYDRGKLINQYNQAKQEYLSIYDPGQKKGKRDQINILIEEIMIYDKKRQIETDKTWRKYQERQQDNLFGEENKQLALGGLSEKEKEKLSQQIEEFNKLKQASLQDHFEWHLNFNEVFDQKGGFDVVIANPPYVDSETMVKEQPVLRQKYSELYSTAKGNWDLYIPFLELGYTILTNTGIASFITPNKWFAIGYGKEIRKKLIGNIFRIANCNSVKVFDAGNSPVVTIFGKNSQTKEIMVDKFDNYYSIENSFNIERRFLADNLGLALSDFLAITINIRNQPKIISDYYNVENPCSVSEAYEIKKILIDLLSYKHPGQLYFRFVNTGTIDSYHSLWGEKKTTYLKSKYYKPIVNKLIFQKLFPKRYKQTIKPKLIISGMRHFESFFDEKGCYIAGKSTEILLEKNKYNLKLALCLLNSRLIGFYIKQAYSVLGIDGGINFSIDLIASLPIPELITIDIQKPFIDMVDKIITITNSGDYLTNTEKQAKVKEYEKQIDQLVYKLYGLTPEEIEIIESKNNNG